MACYQMGQVKKGMKAIERALRLEPDSGDLMAMKASLLVSMGHAPEAADLFHQAWMADADEDYLILEGRVRMLMGRVDEAYETLKQVTDQTALKEAGIDLRDMKRKWPFIGVRGFSIKNIFGRGRKN